MELQVKLLRVLETGTIMRVGGTEAIKVSVRVIAATNRQPEEAVAAGKLREDLFYRLNVFPIQLPPLIARRDDVELLAEHFLSLLNKEEGTGKTFSAAALERLRAHAWPGNVRELRNVVQRAFILAEEEIGVPALPLAPREPATGSGLELRVGTSVAEMERRLILATLEHFGGDSTRPWAP
jgi:DNA-binding NtrC family response regulator